MNNTGQKFGGRKSGTSNKDKTNIRTTFQLLVENNLDAIQSDLDCLKPFDRVKVIIDLAKFVLPTLKAIDFSDSNNKERISPVVINFKVIEPKNENRDLHL